MIARLYRQGGAAWSCFQERYLESNLRRLRDEQVPRVDLPRSNQTLSDDLEASLFEWRGAGGSHSMPSDFHPRTEDTGRQSPRSEARLVNRKLMNWPGGMPSNQKCEMMLSGDLRCSIRP